MALILIIEDDENIRDNMADVLEYEGYSLLKAENGMVGVQSALNFLPDLILCDVMMPEMDGYEVLSALRGEPSTSRIPFVFLTAKADRSSIRHGMDLGADDYLVKPHTMPELLATVSTRLEKHILIDQAHQQNFDELRENLVKMLPHELRTPLSVILGNAQMMHMDYETLDKQDVRQMADEILSAGERLHRVIDNYFLYAQTELARYDTAQIEAIAKQRAEMPGTLIRELARMKATQSNRINDLTIQTDDVAIRISPESLWKILEELMDNALKFSKSGTPIEITGRREGDVYILEVSDQGRGMTPDQIKQVGIYMQFERQQYEQQGMGLGLILAKRLAQLSSGDLSIVSELGRGTTVSVGLPLAP